MTVQFHPPEDLDPYAERVLAVLARAALPRIMERLEQLRAQEARSNSSAADKQRP